MKSIAKPSVSAPLLALVILILIAVADLAGATGQVDNARSLLLATTVLQAAVFVLPCIFYGRLKHIKYVRTARLRLFSMSRLVLMITMLGVMLTGSLLINIAVFALSGDSGMFEGSGDAISGISGSAGVFLTLITVCVMPAVCEEFAFRGIIFGEYSEYGSLPAVALSSLLFAMAHFSIPAFMSNLFCGMMLGILVAVTRSLIAPMILHAAYNVFTVFFASYVRSLLFEPLGTLFAVFICAGLFLVFTALMLSELQATYDEYSRSYKVVGDEDVSSGDDGSDPEAPPVKNIFQRSKEALLSIPLAACVLVFFIFTVIIRI